MSTAAPQPRHRFNRFVGSVILVLLLFAVTHAVAPPAPAHAHWPIDPAVTFVLGPVDADGYIDYSAAINKHHSKGVTPDNNAGVLIWRALGPRPEGGHPMVPLHFKLLGIPEPPEKGDYFVGKERYARDHLKLDPDDVLAFQKDETVFKHPWTAKGNPRLAEWLKLNEKPIALVIEATLRPRYFMPLLALDKDGKHKGLIGAQLPMVQKTHEIGSALLSRAMLKLAAGDEAGAWSDLQAIHRLARLVAQGSTLIELLVGLALERMACEADAVLLEHSRADAKTLARYDRELRALPTIQIVADRANWTERIIFLDMMQFVHRYGPRGLETIGADRLPEKSWSRLFEARVDSTPAMRLGNEWFDSSFALTG